MKKICLLVISLSLFVIHASAQLQLPDIISDSMVLQQNTNVPIWGWTSPGEKVEVNGSWSDKTIKAVADDDGKWMVKLATPRAGGPYDVTIKTNETKTLHGILIYY